jgi:hypothetical protein
LIHPSAELPLALRASGLLLALPKSNQKARHLTRWFDSHRANRTSLCFSARRGCSDSTSVHCFAIAAIHRRAPSGILPPRLRCSAPRTAPLIHEAVHPCTTSTNAKTHRRCEPSLLRQDAAETGPPEARRRCVGKVRRRAHTTCARSLNVHGCTSSELRSTLAKSEGRMPGDRAAGCVFLWLSFFAQALRRRSGANSAAGRVAAKGRLPGVKKVSRSPAGRVEALHFYRERSNKIKMDFTRFLSRTLWAIRCANVRFGVLPTQSRFRGNDDRKIRVLPLSEVTRSPAGRVETCLKVGLKQRASK